MKPTVEVILERMLFCKCVWPWRNISCSPWEVFRKYLESNTLLITKITITHLQQRVNISTLIHCKCIDCQKYNFSWCNDFLCTSTALLAFNYCPKYCSCIFVNTYFFYHKDCCAVKQCTKIFKNTTFCGVMISNADIYSEVI